MKYSSNTIQGDHLNFENYLNDAKRRKIVTLKKATPLSTLIKYLAIPLMLTLGLWLTLTGPALAAGPIRVTPGGNPAADGSN